MHFEKNHRNVFDFVVVDFVVVDFVVVILYNQLKKFHDVVDIDC